MSESMKISRLNKACLFCPILPFIGKGQSIYPPPVIQSTLYSSLSIYRIGRRFAGETLTEVEDALEACRHFATSMDEDYNDEEAASLPPPSAPKVKPSVEQKKFYVVDCITPGKPLLLFIAGDRSKVGKSR